jgi:ATP synthase protein I
VKSDRDLAQRIGQADRRRRAARNEPGGSLWTQIARVSTLGWMVALPIALGAIVGHLLDRWLGTGITWALALLGLGILVAGYGLWSELRRKV